MENKLNKQKKQTHVEPSNWRHSLSIIGILFALTLISLVVVICVKDKVPDGFIASMVALLSSLALAINVNQKKS